MVLWNGWKKNNKVVSYAPKMLDKNLKFWEHFLWNIFLTIYGLGGIIYELKCVNWRYCENKEIDGEKSY